MKRLIQRIKRLIQRIKRLIPRIKRLAMIILKELVDNSKPDQYLLNQKCLSMINKICRFKMREKMKTIQYDKNNLQIS